MYQVAKVGEFVVHIFPFITKSTIVHRTEMSQDSQGSELPFFQKSDTRRTNRLVQIHTYKPTTPLHFLSSLLHTKVV